MTAIRTRPVLVATTLLLAACSASPAAPSATGAAPSATGAAPSATGAAPSAAASTDPTADVLSQGLPVTEGSVTVGVGGLTLLYLPVYVADGLGYYDDIESELGVDFEITQLAGGSDATNALVSGQIDMMVGIAADAVTMSARGEDAVIVQALFNTGAVILTANNESGVTSPDQLAGRSVGLSSIGSGAYVQAVAIAEAYGVDPNEIEWTPLGGVTAVLPALEAGRIDVMAGGEPYATETVLQGYGTIISDGFQVDEARKVFPNGYISSAIVTKEQLVSENPGAVQAFVYQTIRAAHWIRDHLDDPDAITAALPEDLQMFDQRALSGFYERAATVLSTDGVAEESAMDEVVKTQIISEIIDQAQADAIDLSILVNNDFAEAASSALR